jgi:citrate lyase beta subunit
MRAPSSPPSPRIPARALSLDGRMIDRPHLIQAQRILAAAGR